MHLDSSTWHATAGSLVEVDARSGEMRRQWPLAGVPDATFFNPTSGLVHVAIGDPGLIQSVDPRTGASAQFITANGAKTTALIEPDRLYVFSPLHKGSSGPQGSLGKCAIRTPAGPLSQPRFSYWR